MYAAINAFRYFLKILKNSSIDKRLKIEERKNLKKTK